MALRQKAAAIEQVQPLRLLSPAAVHKTELSEQLWAAVYLPQLALDVLLPEAMLDEPAVCSVEQKKACSVLLANGPAQDLGITAGMALSAARALIPNLKVLHRDTHKEQQAAEHLAAQLYNVSAWVHLAEPNMLLLELKASMALFGGLDALLAHLRSMLAEPQRHFLLAVAPTPSAATLLALSGDETPLLHTRDTAGRLASVPLAVMAGSHSTWFVRLQKLGLQHYGELLRLPQAGLRKRFGGDFADYLQALQGKRVEHPALWKPPSRYEQHQDLLADISVSQQLLPALRQMLDALCLWLQQRAARIQRFTVELYGHKQRLLTFDVVFLRPSNRREAMQRLLELKLESVVLTGPVAGISLSVEQLHYARQHNAGQQSLWLDEQSNDDSWWDSLETIQARLGANAVMGLACKDEHRPEQAWQAVLPGEELAGAADAAENLAARPLWLHQPPRRLTASEQRQLNLQSRPERISSGWWDDKPVQRDYFVAQGCSHKKPQTLWVFRDLASDVSQWFCHGVFY